MHTRIRALTHAHANTHSHSQKQPANWFRQLNIWHLRTRIASYSAAQGPKNEQLALSCSPITLILMFKQIQSICRWHSTARDVQHRYSRHVDHMANKINTLLLIHQSCRCAYCTEKLNFTDSPVICLSFFYKKHKTTQGNKYDLKICIYLIALKGPVYKVQGVPWQYGKYVSLHSHDCLVTCKKGILMFT